jgi:hypothetical protein
VGLLGDQDYPFGPPPAHARPPAPPLRTHRPAPLVPPWDDNALPYYNEEAKDGSDDFVGYVFHVWQTTMEEGREFQLPTTMAEEEIERLGILVSEVDRSVRPPLPRYATDIIPPGLTEDEALHGRCRTRSPPAAATTSVVQSVGCSTSTTDNISDVPPAANWPWAIPDFIVLDNEEEE